jgi:hypothetical protein
MQALYDGQLTERALEVIVCRKFVAVIFRYDGWQSKWLGEC